MGEVMEDRELIQLVLDFAREMNDLERTFPLKDFLGGKSQQFHAQLHNIWSRYLTPRKMQRSTGGFHSPPLFRKVTEEAVITVGPGKNRRVVEVLVDGFECDFQFALVCRDGQWRIDSLKMRYHSEDGPAEDDMWVYGKL